MATTKKKVTKRTTKKKVAKAGSKPNKIRVWELAQALGVSTDEVIAAAKRAKLRGVNNRLKGLTPEQAQKIRAEIMTGGSSSTSEASPAEPPPKKKARKKSKRRSKKKSQTWVAGNPTLRKFCMDFIRQCDCG